MRPKTLRSSMIAFSTGILLVLILAALYSSLATSELSRYVEHLFRSNLAVKEIHRLLGESEASLTEYLRTKDTEPLNRFLASTALLEEKSTLELGSGTPEEAGLLGRSLVRMVGHYLDLARSAVDAKRGRDVGGYTRHYEASRVSAQRITLILDRLQDLSLEASLPAFKVYSGMLPLVAYTSTALLISSFLLSFLLLVRFSYRITDPLHHLALAAQAVGRGDYTTAYRFPSSTEEVRATAEAFRIMQENVRISFAQIEARAELEKKLLEEELKGMLMSHQLKEAELLALQTQINPHFLYNTLSAGLQLAWSENAEHTADFLENLGGFIRYVLKTPSRMVPVREEVECVRRYINLMRLRFSQRYEFVVEMDPGVLSTRIPALILQPLMENSMAHGLKDREEGGQVVVSGKLVRARNQVWLSVRDNGTGMPEGDKERLLEGEGTPEGSIGLGNVIRRIKIATGGLGQVQLLTPEDGGLEVRIILPWSEVRP